MTRKIYIVVVGIFVISLLNACTIAKTTSPSTNNDMGLNSNESVGNTNDSQPAVNSTKILDLSNKDLNALPKYVLDKTDLESLDISDNKFTGALPAEIRQLKNLKVLKASNNQMTGVPAEIGQLSKLELLDLSNNRLTGLPYELGNLKNLKTLILTGNNYSQQDLEVIRKGLTATNIIL